MKRAYLPFLFLVGCGAAEQAALEPSPAPRDLVYESEIARPRRSPRSQDGFGVILDHGPDYILVGVPNDNAGGAGVDWDHNWFSSGGAAHVFRRTRDGWREEVFVQPLEPSPADGMGRTGVLLGDELLLGVGGAMAATDNGGSVDRFFRRDGRWVDGDILRSDLTEPEHRGFGATVASDGEFLAVAHARRDEVIIYRRVGTDWNPMQRLSEPGLFGAAMAFVGAELIISAPWSGRLHVFSLQGNVWRETQTIPSALDRSGHLGLVLSVYGDRLAAASPGVWPGPEIWGNVHIFSRVDNMWVLDDIIVSEAPGTPFGAAVSIREDALLVGAPGKDDGYVQAYWRGPEGWQPHQKFEQTDPAFGNGVALEADHAWIGCGGCQAGSAYGSLQYYRR